MKVEWLSVVFVAPFLVAMLSVGTPSNDLTGGQVIVNVCGDTDTLTCASSETGVSCDDSVKWTDGGDPDSTDEYVEDTENVNPNHCQIKNPGTSCEGSGSKPKHDPKNCNSPL